MVSETAFGGTCTSTSQMATKSYVDSIINPYRDPKMVPTLYRYRINIEVSTNDDSFLNHSFRAMIEWIADNKMGKYEYRYVLTGLNTRVYIFAFDRKRDAVGFKLRWA